MRIILQPYQSIREASATVGLSQTVLRRGCRDGTIPHIRSGRMYYVDIPALLDKLDLDQQKNNMKDNISWQNMMF